MSRLAPPALLAQAVPDDPEPEPTLTVREAAALLGLTDDQVRLALQTGRLRGVKPGDRPQSHWAVFRWSVDALLAPEAPGLIPAALAEKFRRFSRKTTELLALGQEIEDDLRAASPCRDGGLR